jgi:DNA polymerase III epsilon subunit-like protein
MSRTYVALDLETTGLDPERDAIIEIGAVRFRTSLESGTVQAKVLDKWSTLVNPGRPIPIQIQQFTGITPGSRRPRPALFPGPTTCAAFVGRAWDRGPQRAL